MLRELDINEMEEVSGGFANFVFGAAAGAFTYLVFNGSTGQDFTLTGFLASTAFGAATSGLSALGTNTCLLYTSPSPRDGLLSRMPSSA